MSEFKIGDTVKLTGEAWGKGGTPPRGMIVEITTSTPGFIGFEWEREEWYIEGGYEAELVVPGVPKTAGLTVTLSVTNLDEFKALVAEASGVLERLSNFELNVEVGK